MSGIGSQNTLSGFGGQSLYCITLLFISVRDKLLDVLILVFKYFYCPF